MLSDIHAVLCGAKKRKKNRSALHRVVFFSVDFFLTFFVCMKS